MEENEAQLIEHIIKYVPDAFLIVKFRFSGQKSTLQLIVKICISKQNPTPLTTKRTLYFP